MDNSKEHQDIVLKLAVFEERMTGKLDGINSRLDVLNHKTSKNTGAIETLQERDRQIFDMVANQGRQEQELMDRQEKRDVRDDSWRKRWQDLLFGSLQWLLPALIIGILLNGRAIAEFLGFVK